nr:proline-rich receptor-like protein kinase PERK9 [Aegilops tauschii subsp. strangulata]
MARIKPCRPDLTAAPPGPRRSAPSPDLLPVPVGRPRPPPQRLPRASPPLGLYSNVRPASPLFPLCPVPPPSRPRATPPWPKLAPRMLARGPDHARLCAHPSARPRAPGRPRTRDPRHPAALCNSPAAAAARPPRLLLLATASVAPRLRFSPRWQRRCLAPQPPHPSAAIPAHQGRRRPGSHPAPRPLSRPSEAAGAACPHEPSRSPIGLVGITPQIRLSANPPCEYD